MIVHCQAQARAGLLGNPSDIYGGKAISFLIRDFSAKVRLWESPQLTFRLHPDHDRSEFADLADLVTTVRRHGYYGMQRLLFATCARFAAYCQERGLPLRKANFTLEYETSVPRQSGLGGSSAMIIAALRALLRFHRVPVAAVPPQELAALALSVEVKELGIAAGLQDRVVQAFGALTYMDFSGAQPCYQRLDVGLLPRFAIAYLTEQTGLQESGRIHAGIRSRWEAGDPEVTRVMREIAACAEAGRTALLRRDFAGLGQLMNRNFDLRRGLFGDQLIGEHTVELVELARAAGLPAKLPGSSGAALILLSGPRAPRGLAEAYEAKGYRFAVVHVQ